MIIRNGYYLPFNFSDDENIHEAERYLRLKPKIIMVYYIKGIYQNKKVAYEVTFDELKSLYNAGFDIHSLTIARNIMLYESAKDRFHIDSLAKVVFKNNNSFIKHLSSKYAKDLKALINENLVSYGYKNIDDLFAYKGKINLRIHDFMQFQVADDYFNKSISLIFQLLNNHQAYIKKCVKSFYRSIYCVIHAYNELKQLGFPKFLYRSFDDEEPSVCICTYDNLKEYYFKSGNDFNDWLDGKIFKEK